MGKVPMKEALKSASETSLGYFQSDDQAAGSCNNVADQPTYNNDTEVLVVSRRGLLESRKWKERCNGKTLLFRLLITAEKVLAFLKTVRHVEQLSVEAGGGSMIRKLSF
jgi:hypothetical protein